MEILSYADLWSNEDREKEQRNIKKFEEEEKDLKLFNQRYKEDIETIETEKTPFNSGVGIICRDDKNTKVI